MTDHATALDIGQDIEFQYREWSVQRAAWLVGAVLLIAGTLGLFGGGPLSHAAVTSGPLTVDYDRFVRQRAPMQMTLRIDASAVNDDAVTVRIDRTYLDKVDVEHVLPEPDTVAAAGDGAVYRFAVTAGTASPVEVTFDLEPAEPGMAEGRISLDSGSSVDLTQFIYP